MKRNKSYCVQDLEIIKSKDVAKGSNFAHDEKTLYIFWILIFCDKPLKQEDHVI